MKLLLYLVAVVVGIVTSVISLAVLHFILTMIYPLPTGVAEVSLNLLAPLPIAVALVGFAAGFYLVLKFSY